MSAHRTKPATQLACLQPLTQLAERGSSVVARGAVVRGNQRRERVASSRVGALLARRAHRRAAAAAGACRQPPGTTSWKSFRSQEGRSRGRPYRIAAGAGTTLALALAFRTQYGRRAHRRPGSPCERSQPVSACGSACGGCGRLDEPRCGRALLRRAASRPTARQALRRRARNAHAILCGSAPRGAALLPLRHGAVGGATGSGERFLQAPAAAVSARRVECAAR